MKLKKFIFVLLTIFTISLFCGCIKQQEIESIEIKAAKTDLVVGESVQITYVILPSEATINDLNIESSNEAVLQIEIQGDLVKVSAIAPGTEIITFSSKNNSGVKDTLFFIVTESDVEITKLTNISIFATSTELIAGDTQDISYTLTPTSATIEDVLIESSDPSVLSVTVDNNLVSVRGIKEGTAVITFTAKLDNTIKESISFTVLKNVNAPIELTIYSINDFHGMIFESDSGVGISKLGKYLIDNKNENSLILSAGDMFQGTAVSSMSRGKAIVDMMNYIGFDAMALGNHEFDWGIDTVLKYWDEDLSNGEAEFPLLCANVTDKRTNQLATWANPYTIIEKSGLKIGIIGIIGSDQESDILATYVTNYEFTDEFTVIEKYSEILRTEEKCDIVIVSAHCDTSDYNNSIANLTGDKRVDAVLNGHTHRAYYGEISRSEGVPLPYVQSGCYGEYIGQITLEISPSTKEITNSSASYIEAKRTCYQEDKGLLDIIATYQEYIDVANEELGVSGEYITKFDFGDWASRALRERFDADIALINTGGVRANGFPISVRHMITYGDVFTMLPFENMVRTVQLTGYQINTGILPQSDYYFISHKTAYGSTYVSDELYTVVTIDYCFENTRMPFLSGVNRVDTGLLLRDVIAELIKQNATKNGTFKY